jgi:hypothetical protein
MSAIGVGEPRVRSEVLTIERDVSAAVNPLRERAGRRAAAQMPWAGRSSSQPAAVALTWSRSRAGLCGAWVRAPETAPGRQRGSEVGAGADR